MTYLDHQASAPLAPEALAAMMPWLTTHHGNPHSSHREGRRARAAVEAARAQVAALLPVGGRVVFTGGATEALNWAIKGMAGPILTHASEHMAVLGPVAAAERQGRAVQVRAVDGCGGAEARPADAPGGLHAAMLVNNEIGTIHAVAELAGIAHAQGALFLCDAVQGYGRVPVPDTVDLVAVSAHKIGGPKGIGALWIRDGVAVAPLLDGGDQEGGRSGTLSPALCAGFGAAASLMAEHGEADRDHVETLWRLAVDRLAGWTVNGSVEHRWRGNLNVRREGLDVARLMSDCRDIAFSAGSACASGSGRASHVLRAIGLSEAQARSSIRLGWGRETTADALAAALDRLVAAADRQ